MEENIYGYDRETLECLAGFESLWQRVRERTAPVSFSEDETLLHLIRQEICAARGYTALTRMFQNHSRTLLAAHGADARRRARRLQAEYFIRTGLRCDSSADCGHPGEKLASLRHLFQREQELSAAYEKAAMQTRCPVLKELYTRFSAETGDRAKALRALLLDCF